jgi:hypothetical protein
MSLASNMALAGRLADHRHIVLNAGPIRKAIDQACYKTAAADLFEFLMPLEFIGERGYIDRA